MLTTLLSILTNRILWSFLGVTALAAVVWMIGPLLSIVDTRPLESEQNRVISIAVVYLIWAQSHILPRLYNAWLNRKLMDKLKENTASPEAADPQKRLNSEEQILASRFDEAAQMLKKAHFSKAGQGAQWTQRFSTQYLYQLPWYVIIGAPGSGKTTLLSETLLRLKGKTACAVIEGDQQTVNDAARIRATGTPAIQVNTGKGCHLDAQMIADAAPRLPLADNGILFIENVGNLVCPASFDLGERHKVAVLSVTEGEDKPLKYPHMFAADRKSVV